MNELKIDAEDTRDLQMCFFDIIIYHFIYRVISNAQENK